MYANSAGAYQQVGITTADPGRLVILCYEQAIENLKKSIAHYDSGELEKKAETIAKSLDFIGELNRALDFEKGGDIAVRLHSLYNYMCKRIMEGDLKRNTKTFEEVIHLLTELKSAWEEIFSGVSKGISPKASESKAAASGLLRRIEV